MFARPVPENEHDRLNWLRLIRSVNLGPIGFWAIMARFGTAEAALEALPTLSHRTKRDIRLASLDSVDRELDRLQAMKGQVVDYGHPDYPPLLKQLDDAPPVLMALGQTQLLSKKSIAVVGARHASAQGLIHASNFASAFGQHGFLVVSGLARGIDRAAHEGALHSGTVAILGGGVDVIYPQSNRGLYDRIKELGVIISEMPLFCQPQARHFPRRNRLVSGMSRGVLVIEAALKSGSMITARLAQEQGRETMAIPGNPADPRSRGCHDLIKSGAALIETPDDVIEQLRRPFEQPGPAVANKSKQRSFTLDHQVPSLDTSTAPPLLQLLSAEPVSIDDLARLSGQPLSRVTAEILAMELAGEIERTPGNKVSRISPALQE